MRIVFLLLLLAGPAMAQVAPGAAADVPAEYQALLDALIKALVAGVFWFVAIVLRRLAAYLEQRWDLHLDLLREERVRDVAQWAAAEAEEWARGKNKSAGAKMIAGADKLARAAGHVAQRLGMPQDQAERAVLSVLPYFAARVASAIESETRPYAAASTADLQPNA